MKILNVDQICTINVYKKHKVYDLIYYKQRKHFFGLIKYKEGFWSYDGYVSNKQILEKGYIIEDNVAYYKPYIKIHISDGSSIEKSFNNVDELDEYLKEYIYLNIKTLILYE